MNPNLHPSIVERGEVVTGRSLPELAEIVNDADRLAMEAATEAFTHAVRAGAALNEAFLQVPRGEWLTWLNENCPGLHRRRASEYRRFAFYAPQLATAGVTSAVQAAKYLRDNDLVLPWPRGKDQTLW